MLLLGEGASRMKQGHWWLPAIITLVLLPVGSISAGADDDADPVYTSRDVTSIPRVERPPIIDGRGTDTAWNSANKLALYVPGTEEKPDDEILVRVCRDRETMYALFSVSGPKVGRKGGDDTPFEELDSVELLIDLGADARTYNQFRVAHGNIAEATSYMEGGGTKRVGRHGDWESMTAREAGGWSAELAIPWASIGLAPRNGTLLGMNFICNQPAGCGTVAWEGDADNLRHPAAFGIAVFGADWEPDRPKLHILNIDADGGQCQVLVQAVGRAFHSSNFGLMYRLTVPGAAPVESVAAMDLRNNKTAEVPVGPVKIGGEGPASLVLACKRGNKVIKVVAITFPVRPSGI